MLKYGVVILINTTTVISDTEAARVYYSRTKTSVISFLLNMSFVNMPWDVNHSVISLAKDTGKGNKFWTQYTDKIYQGMGRKKLIPLDYIISLHNTLNIVNR